MTKPLDLKSTLNLPRTAFPMKASLPQSEPRQLALWETMDIYQRILESRAGADPYVLHDGPPYPTGEIHLGTGLNKILKDMVVKSRTMSGFQAPYVPGWDCHGLPIETKVEKELPGGKGSVPPAEFRRRCREYAARYVEIHRREFKRLGIFGQWDDPYLTMSPQYESEIAGAFVTFLEKGYVYRGLKPVYWCIYDTTALAEAEVEYEDHTSPSIWVRFPAAAGPAAEKLGAGVDALIWTTTPWTLPANRALAFHPDFEYTLLETDSGTFLVAAKLAAAIAKQLGLKLRGTRGAWQGRELEGLKFRHPFLDLEVPVVLGDYVTLEQGTGIVHTAPGHGAEDFYTGQRYGLDTYAPLDDEGCFVEGLPAYKGKTVFEANPHIIALLKERGALLAEGKLTHSYPHCWRCHKPVIFRATEQWFINLEHAGLRQKALDEIKQVKWTPAWGEERIHGMIATRPDWCISRQRMWGVPLVVFFCDACQARLDDFAALRHVVGWFRREGADAWFARPAEELLPPGTKCRCGASRWRKETDILDVWFDSGSSHLAVLDYQDSAVGALLVHPEPAGGGRRAAPPNAAPPQSNRSSASRWPADMYLEGPDQFRGWFHSSLLVALGVRGRAPYRHVLTHGWTLDDKGVPMSKSLGNVFAPREVCEKWGADLLRLWVASQDFTADVRMSDNVMSQLAEAYRKLRNTLRFALGNLDGFDPARDAVADAQLLEMDRWMLQRTAELVKQCRAWYDAFEFHRVFHALHDFAVVDLSAFYFDVLKDRLYTSARTSLARRSAQTAIFRIAGALLRLLAPILVFTAEEVWRHFPRRKDDPESIHMTVFPEANHLMESTDESLDKNWKTLLLFREDVLKEIERLRVAKVLSGSLEAKVIIRSDYTPTLEFLNKYKSWLPTVFIVSQVEITDKFDQPAATKEPFGRRQIEVERADGKKCERCWNYSTRVGESAEYPTVCERCLSALAEIEQAAAS